MPAVHIAPVVNPFAAPASAHPAAKASSGNAASNPTPSIAADDTKPDTGNDFSQLLNDNESPTSDNNPPPPSDRAADNSRNVSTSALAAQEVGNAAKQNDDLLAHEITSQEAKAMLADIDAALAQHDQSASDQAALQQLKDQLQQIENSGTAQSVGDVVAVLAAAQPNASTSGETNPVAQRMLSWLQKTLGKSSHANQQEASSQGDATDATTVSTAVSATVQSLQASLFRPDDAASAAQTEDDGQEKTRDTIEIVPLAAPLILAQAIPLAPVAATPIDDDAVTATVLQTPIVRPDLDTLIPPLTNADADALPELDLPGFTTSKPNAAADAAAANSAHAAAQDANAKAQATANFAQHLQTPLTNLTPLASDAAKSAADKNAAADANAIGSTQPSAHTDSAANPVLNPSLVGGHSAANSAAAVQPGAATNSGAAVNTAPVAEQVHVAIKQATKEGVEKITIQLNPLELGRVEVKMHTGSDGQTQLSFTVDKPSTFDALSRDARSLERSLQDAGIKADAGSMQFNLRQQPQAQLQSGLNGQGQFSQNQPVPADDDDIAKPGAAVAALTRHYNVNVREGIDIHA